MIVRTADDSIVLLLDRNDSDVLAWHPGTEQEHWTPADGFADKQGLTLLSVEGDPTAMRDAGSRFAISRMWWQRSPRDRSIM